jgi:hypothetical protein
MANEDKASGRVFNSRLRALDTLRISIKSLTKECDRLEKKIEEEGLKGYYSINSDLLRWARRAHSSCYELSILRECQVYIDGGYGRIEELGKETHHGKEEESQDTEATQLVGFARSQSPRGSNDRSQEAGKQDSVSRTGSIMWRLEALALIFAGLGLGFLLFGYP